MGNDHSNNLVPAQKEQLQNLKKNIQKLLASYNHSLNSITKLVFGFQKEGFDTNQLAFLLNKIHNSFGFPQASIIMKALGAEGKIIQRQDLQLFLDQTDKKIHPLQKKFEEFRQLVKQQGSLIYLQSLDFDGDNCLQVQGMGEVFNLLEFSEVEKEYILGRLFKNKNAVPIPDILTILNITEKEMEDDSKPCSLMLLSKSKNVQYTSNNIQIPQILSFSLNQNIKVNQQLIDWLATVVSSGRRFVDVSKPQIKPQHRYVHISELYPQYFLFEMRNSIIKKDAFRKGQGLLMEAKNIRQGHGKDCYLLSALSGVVQIYPAHIYNLFLIDKTNVDVYVVKLFIDGVWDLIICDAEFPINNKKKLVYAQPSKHQIWVLLIEKAWAKVFKSYINIEEGSNEQGLVAVTGAPCLRFEVNKPEHLEQIQHYLGKGYIASVSTNKLNNMSRQDQKKLGIYANHAYTLLYIIPGVVDAITNQTVTLLYLRNPWGRGTWKGNWSFDYLGWSEQMRKKVNYITNPKDGSFFIGLEDFKKYFSKIKVCCFHPEHVNSSQRIKSNRHKYVANKFTIKEKGDYFLSIYQQSKRKHKNEVIQYKLSNCNIYLAKLKDERYIQPLGSKAVSNNNLSIESTFEPGDYLCVSRVKWHNKQEGWSTLTSYGPQPIRFQSITVKDNFFTEFIRLRAHDQIGDKSYYGKLGSPKSFKIVFMSSDLGYGYILICNNEETRSMKGILSLEAAKGIKMITPLTLKINVDIKPKSREVYPCTVSPNGYEYKIIEEMILS